jgi:hypothetical protein
MKLESVQHVYNVGVAGLSILHAVYEHQAFIWIGMTPEKAERASSQFMGVDK